jgi:hypothetical protein
MQTNMPTKLVTYLETGKLVFSFARTSSATSRVLRESCIGPVIERLDRDAVCEGLDALSTWDLDAANVGWRNLIENRFSASRIFKDLQEAMT